MSLESLYRRSPSWARTLMLNAFAMRIERHRYGPRLRSALAEISALERAPRHMIEEYQSKHLQKVVSLAYERSSHYRRAFDDRRLRPQDIRTAADLPLLPLLTKETIRNAADSLLTSPKPLPGWQHGHTSGTTGSPLSLWYDRNTCVMTNAVDARQKEWGGRGETDWIALLLGRVVVPPAQKRPPFWNANYVQRQLWCSSFHLNDENFPLYVAEIMRRGIRFLEGYPSTLYILARYLVRTGKRLPMKAVFSSSETLLELQRSTIEAAFECPLFDFYGHAERTIFATECEAHDGKHLAEEYGITEVVDENGQPVPDGRPGYLVGTSLHNTALPMIRYRTGDISSIVREPCKCGRTLLRIAAVATKAEDIVITPDGRMISPSVLTHPFKPFDQILKSQVIQESIDRLRVKLVVADTFTPEHEVELVAGLRERLGAGVAVEVEQVEEIPSEKSGKFRWVISRVAHDTSLSWDNAAAESGSN